MATAGSTVPRALCPRSLPVGWQTSRPWPPATDWGAVRAVPFTGQCPTAYDGQKHVYAFPADAGDLVFDSCEFDLSTVPVIQLIDAALFGGG